MNKEDRKKAKICHHDFDTKSYGTYYWCGKCGTNRFWEFDPYLYQNPSKEYIKEKLSEINKALTEINIFKDEIIKYLKK